MKRPRSGLRHSRRHRPRTRYWNIIVIWFFSTSNAYTLYILCTKITHSTSHGLIIFQPRARKINPGRDSDLHGVRAVVRGRRKPNRGRSWGCFRAQYVRTTRTRKKNHANRVSGLGSRVSIEVVSARRPGYRTEPYYRWSVASEACRRRR